MPESKENIVMFPFMAQGHIIPFLALSLHIHRTRGYSITFINTPLNIHKLRSTLPSTVPIRFLELPFSSSDHGLPPNVENTDILPYHLIIHLLRASTSLRPAFKQLISDLLSEHPPLCIIADIFFGWTADVAKELGVFHAVFSGASAFGLACYYSLWRNLPNRNSESDTFSLPDFPEAGPIHVTQLALTISQADGTDDWSIFQEENLPAWENSSAILFNTLTSFDQTGMSYFRRKLGKPAWAVGPILLPTENRSRIGKENGVSNKICLEWLDSKPDGSVLFISFGSMNTISLTHMMELAKAVELTGTNFIWVVRPPIEFDINSEFNAKEWLPEGFEKRITESGRGLLVPNWAPQVEIISHRSILAFVTHCGWSSVLEALSNGVPMLGWPMAAEQFFNVKLLEEVGVCVELARGKSCQIGYEDLVEKIGIVIGESERGESIRRRASEVKELIKNSMRDDDDGFRGDSVKGLDEFFSAATRDKANQVK